MKLSLSAKFNSVILLFVLTIFFLPYDSLPFFNYSVYSPSSVVFIVPALILHLITKPKISKINLCFLLFFFISALHSLLSGYIYHDLYTSVKHIVTLLVMLSSFLVAEYAFTFKEHYKMYTQAFIGAFALSLLAGCLQLLNQFNLQIGFIRWFTSLFVTRLYDVRIQMLSGEPSWAVLHLLVLIPFLYYSDYRSKFKDYSTGIAILLFFLAFSSYGYAVFLLSFVLFVLLCGKLDHIFKYLLYILFFTFSSIIVVNAFIQCFGINDYYAHRFSLDFYLNNNVLENDGSIFVRLVFPYIGVLEFLDFPFGYGGGFYYLKAGEYLSEFFSYGLNYGEVYYYFTNNSMKPMCLYAKLLAEEGIFAILIFYFFYSILKKCVSKREKYLWCLAMALNFNFASYACVDFWILLGALSGGFFRKENIGGENI